jgi:hypothetical protein
VLREASREMVFGEARGPDSSDDVWEGVRSFTGRRSAGHKNGGINGVPLG